MPRLFLCFFFSSTHLETIHSSLFPLKSLSKFLTVYTSSFLSPFTLSYYKYYYKITYCFNSLDQVLLLRLIFVLPFGCVNRNFTFILPHWHLNNFWFLSFLSLPANTIFLPLRSSFHASFMKYVTDTCTYFFNTGPFTPISVLFKYSFQSPYSRTPHKRDGREKEKRKSIQGEIFTMNNYCHFIKELTLIKFDLKISLPSQYDD